MFQVRFHGRGGQGVVTAAELLASAAFREDRHAQAFPSFGSERMGAPVMSFCRIDDKRFLGDKALRKGWQVPVDAAPTGKRVLVVGAGSSGLSAAYHLARLGHSVTIEMEPEPT
jgi:2-oxoacid:acceptor oxidoreductase gamma subunit (pyruvate/2-ketoisovalerate family)